jgi:hypothetical protein
MVTLGLAGLGLCYGDTIASICVCFVHGAGTGGQLGRREAGTDRVFLIFQFA